jgi:predicted secreted protein
MTETYSNTTESPANKEIIETAETYNTTLLQGLIPGQVKLELDVQGGTGYDWYIKSVNDVEYEKTQTIERQNNKDFSVETNLQVAQSRPGSKTIRSFTVRTFAEGSIKLVFEYKRIWLPNNEKTRTVVIHTTKQ